MFVYEPNPNHSSLSLDVSSTIMCTLWLVHKQINKQRLNEKKNSNDSIKFFEEIGN